MKVWPLPMRRKPRSERSQGSASASERAKVPVQASKESDGIMVSDPGLSWSQMASVGSTARTIPVISTTSNQSGNDVNARRTN